MITCESVRLQRMYLDVHEVDGVANILEDGLERHVQVATLDACWLTAERE